MCMSPLNPGWVSCPHCSADVIEKSEIERNNFKQQINEENVPFYEKLVDFLKLPYIFTCALLGILILFIHYFVGQVYRINIFSDFSWMLSGMTAYVLILVIFATKQSRKFVIDLYDVFSIDVSNNTYRNQLRKTLKNSQLITYGIGFGITNTCLGVFFGIWYDDLMMKLSISVQFFVVGFVNGFAICGIIGVVKLIGQVSKEEDLRLSIMEADKCGGTSRLGNVLVQFSFITLSAGILISLYIYNSSWVNKGWLSVKTFIYIWMVFPHLAASTVLLMPGLGLHNILKEFKSRQGQIFRIKSRTLEKEMLELLNNYDLQSMQKFNQLTVQSDQISYINSQLHSMRVWPLNINFGLGYAMTYFASTVIPIIQFVRKVG